MNIFNIFGNRRYDIAVSSGEFPKKSPTSMYLGKVAEENIQVYMDPKELTKHTVLAGITGGGKTVGGNVILEEALNQGACAIIIDPTLEWTGINKPNTDREQHSHYSKFKMYEDNSIGVKSDILSLKLHRKRALDLNTIMTPGLATVVTTDNVGVDEVESYIAELIKNIRNKHFETSKELRLLIIFDEVHIILTKYGGSGKGFIELERATREFREIGIGLILLSQVLEDFIGSIRANVNTEVQMRTTFDNDLDKSRMKYGPKIADAIMRAQSGTGLFHNAEYNIGRPFFITFRPPYHAIGKMKEAELKEYYEMDAMILESKDLVMAKLAREKLRQGEIRSARALLEK